MERYNLIVIGGGAGGLTVATIAAVLGARVALLEKERMGGDCLNYGCVPSKALPPRWPMPFAPPLIMVSRRFHLYLPRI
jgi:flavin-dependent dehydrogenase